MVGETEHPQETHKNSGRTCKLHIKRPCPCWESNPVLIDFQSYLLSVWFRNIIWNLTVFFFSALCVSETQLQNLLFFLEPVMSLVPGRTTNCLKVKVVYWSHVHNVQWNVFSAFNPSLRSSGQPQHSAQGPNPDSEPVPPSRVLTGDRPV